MIRKTTTVQRKHCLAAFMILALAIVIPHIVICKYAIPLADDLYNYSRLQELRTAGNAISAAIAYTKENWLSWQGTYFGCFLLGLMPSVQAPYVGIRVVLALSALLFAVSVIVFVYLTAGKIFGLCRWQAAALSLLAEFGVFHISASNELFTWYGGAVVYLIPLSISLLCISASIAGYQTGRNRWMVLAAILGFLGSGGALEVTGFLCMLYLLYLLHYLTTPVETCGRKQIMRMTAPFLITAAGACFNAFAPGNFVRHTSIDASGSLPVLKRILFSLISVLTRTMTLWSEYAVPFFVGTMLLLLLCSKTEAFGVKKSLLWGCGLVLAPAVAVFPVLLGYNANTLSVQRCIYTCDVALMLCMTLLSFFFAGLIKKIYAALGGSIAADRKYLVLLYLTAVIVFSGTLITKLQNGMNMKILDDLSQGRAMSASSAVTSLYQELETCSGDVILTKSSLPDSVLNVSVPIEDPDYWINLVMVQYYDLDSLVIYWQ